MSFLHWNESLARLLESRCFYALDSERLNKTLLHSQPGLELNLTRSGRGTLHVEGQAIPLTAGTLVIIPEPVPHQLEVHTPGRYARSVLCVAPSSQDDRPVIKSIRNMIRQPIFRTPHSLYLDDASARVFQNLIAGIAAESATQADWWQDMIFAQAYQLLAFAARICQQPRPLQPPGGRLADEIAGYITTHLDEDLTTQTVAEYFEVSREHLSRIFHQHHGITYQQYVLNQRMAAARGLLTKENNYSLLDIALAVGFQSHAHFSRVFHKHAGITPGQFRKLHQIRS